MFQTQLFKKSFITTSLLIIQRRMNEKLPPAIKGDHSTLQPLRSGVHQQSGMLPNSGSTLVKKTDRIAVKKKSQTVNLNSLEGMLSQI